MTTVANPYDTQQSGSGIINGTMSKKTYDTQEKEPVNYNPVSDLTMKGYEATQSQVNKPTETVSGQVDSILASDSPLMQRARALAMQNMNKRGLINSSIAQGAGVAAMTDQATQIGAADANIYGERAIANMNAANQASQFNAGENNQTYRLGLDIASRFGLQKDQQAYGTTEREASQLYNTGERTDQNKFNTGEREAAQGYNTTERESSQNFTAGQNTLNRDQQDRLTAASQLFTSQQNQLDRDQQVNITKLQDSLNNGTVPKTFAANTALATMNQINAILGDKDITPEDKKSATQNVIDIANATLQWGATFYNTPLPAVGTPNSTTPGMINPGAQPAGQPAAAVTPANIPRYYNQFFPAVQ